MSGRFWLLAAGLLGATGIVFGSFGAHVLQDKLSPKDLATFEIGVRYQMYHALALAALAGWTRDERTPAVLSAAGWCLIIGTVLFSGSLYALVTTGPRALGAVAPLGGSALIAGWALVVVGAARHREKANSASESGR